MSLARPATRLLEKTRTTASAKLKLRLRTLRACLCRALPNVVFCLDVAMKLWCFILLYNSLHGIQLDTHGIKFRTENGGEESVSGSYQISLGMRYAHSLEDESQGGTSGKLSYTQWEL